MKNCVICNAEFKPKTSEKTCSISCRDIQHDRKKKEWLANNKQRVSATKKRWKDKTRSIRNKYDDVNKQDRQCVICQKEYIGHFQSKTCSNECRKFHISKGWKRRNPKPEIYKDCEWCSNWFKAYRSNNKFCSVKCEQALRNSQVPRKLNGFKYIVKGCETCNELFNSYLGNAKFCSTKCANKKYHSKKIQNPMRRISARLSHGIRDVIKGRYKNSNVWNFLDFTPDDFRKRFESLFSEGMGWNNMGVWHIDHIRPVSSFDYDSTEHPDFKKCWALNNLQPLWEADNLSKSNKWDGIINR